MQGAIKRGMDDDMKGEGEGRLKYRVVMYERVKRIRKIGRRRGRGEKRWRKGKRITLFRHIRTFIIQKAVSSPPELTSG